MKLIIGLGNPGVKYEKTRHNLGWQIIDALSQDPSFDNWQIKMQFQAQICSGFFNKEKVTLVKPQTFMNDSGIAVKLIARYYRVKVEDILVIHDEIDFPLGEIKIQKNRGAAGHNGVKSIIDNLKSKNFIRLRIGIRPKHKKQIDTENFVLENFTKEEEEIFKKVLKKSVRLILKTLKNNSSNNESN